MPASRGETVKALLAAGKTALTPSESRIAQLLLADYPVAGLGSASSLARRANVSDPTVARFVAKLGFENFAAFQASLLEEVEARLRSPLMMLEAKRAQGTGSLASNYLTTVTNRIDEISASAVAEPYERAAELALGAKGHVLTLGGRFSRHVAGMLAGYLIQFRPKVEDLGPLSLERYDRLLDLSRGDVLMVFDYRRYQNDVIAFARQAHKRGVRIVLFTDPWMSPIAEVADVVLLASAEVGSPYDSLAPAVAQMEALVAHALERGADAMERRTAALERLRRANAVTVDEPGPA